MKNQNNKLIVDKSNNSCAIPKRFHHRVNLKILVQFWIANLFLVWNFVWKTCLTSQYTWKFDVSGSKNRNHTLSMKKFKYNWLMIKIWTFKIPSTNHLIWQKWTISHFLFSLYCICVHCWIYMYLVCTCIHNYSYSIYIY